MITRNEFAKHWTPIKDAADQVETDKIAAATAAWLDQIEIALRKHMKTNPLPELKIRIGDGASLTRTIKVLKDSGFIVSCDGYGLTIRW